MIADRPGDGRPDAAETGAGPVAPGERVAAVDVLRGFALLGILLMNIADFGLPNTGMADVLDAPSPYDPDRLTGLAVSVLFEGKMRAIFSMLFGAGVVLLTSRAERRGDPGRVADVYYRRTLWLLAFGLIHAYFVWEGDILYDYAVGGLLLYPFRNARPRTLIALGVLLLAAMVPKMALHARHLEHLRAEAARADAAEAAGKAPTKAQRKARDEWKEELKDVRPTAEEIAAQIADHQGGYWHLFRKRAEEVVRAQSRDYYLYSFWDTAGMMLVGMGLLKLGVLSAARSTRTYLIIIAAGLGLGLPAAATMVGMSHTRPLDPVGVARAGMLYEPSRLASALGYVGLVMLVVKAGLFQPLSTRLAAVGRMALSQYLATSLACTLFFNGYGLGYYGQLRRHQIYYVVLAIWAVQLLVSPIWLRYFRFGPMEWLWRSLTYGHPQPMRASARGPEAFEPAGDETGSPMR
jgi:uncharacterized protein